MGALLTIDDLHDYIDLAKFLDEQELKVYLCGRWATDVEFGREMLNGVNPVVIKKCTALPKKKFPVTNDMVQPFLTRGMNLDQEMEVLDHKNIAIIFTCIIIIITGWSCVHL